jgi:hypothetical protein
MNRRPLLLIAAASLAPLFWAGQVMLSYFVTAEGCYPGDGPRPGMPAASLQAAIWAFDMVALAAAVTGGVISLLSWRRLGHGHEAVVATGEGRTRFLILWGLYSSLWFFFAILFNAIASLMVPPCAN